ncbi:hypothetical protein A1O3_00558 [Capronia epimyces CBS 606.96]|uniref:Apple domain-containing protein n=1 Tax=Capronia epimyces CBS 606.96 TaxID=1182542 RepID=W9YHI8_9EURO|nr:uncharacterized protein A1O3_00558 [Capronia epimyces CBS 606.96]EXJ92008.1 hypothetical protein A1O3_00558 [Capronia epimyces CBS 606.96]
MSHMTTNPTTASSNNVSSIQPSSGLSDKYPAVSDHENHPEVVLGTQQDPYNSYHQVNPSYSQQQNQPYGQYSSGYPPPRAGDTVTAPAPRRLNPWGLSPLAFGILVAAVTAVIVGGAVGGGVAGAMSNKHSDSSDLPASTVTITATASSASSASTATSSLPLPSSLKNFVAPEPYYVGTLENPGCPQDTSTIEVQYSNAFSLYCGIDFHSGVPDLTDSSLVVADFVGLFAYSITDCLYACSNARHFFSQWGQDHMQTCKGVTWNYQMAQSNSSGNANCWLKNGTSQGYQCNTCISAMLSQ